MPLADALPWLKGRHRGNKPPTEGQHVPPSDLDSHKDLERAIRFGQRIVFYGIFGFLIWATLAPIDEGAVAPGHVTVESRRKTITPLVSGMVAKINVTENQRVKAGDVLLTLENTQQQAAFDSAIQRYFAMAVRLARLEAEQRRDPFLQLPAELEGLDSEPWARHLLASEASLLTSRNESFHNEMAILRERIAAAEERLRGSRQQLASRQQQHELLGEQVRGLSKLVDAGHTPRNQLLETQRLHVEVARLAGELETAIAIGANNVAELKLQQSQRRKEIQRDLDIDIVEARRELTLLKEAAKAAKDELERTVLKAPIDGQVVSLQGLAPGTAVANGTHLMDIVPEGDRLLIDVRVAPHLIDRIHPGLSADVRINAFPDEPQLVIAGQVLSLSSDQLINSASGEAYYLARIEITPEGQEKLGQRKLRPGMPVEAIIRTGERSFLAYLLKPLTQRMFSAFRES